jgi:hypothetical protein
LVAVAELAVDDRAAERAPGSVVRWCHARDGDERPEREPELQEVVREPAAQAVAFAGVASMLKQLA